jgi:hypothetical protein
VAEAAWNLSAVREKLALGARICVLTVSVAALVAGAALIVGSAAASHRDARFSVGDTDVSELVTRWKTGS